ncbi:hypothetical protein ACIP0B_28460, partial [Pseudomonas sp. NPDC089534]
AADGKWSIELTGVSLNVLHSVKAVAQYGKKPVSNIRGFTSINGQRPAITAAQDSKGTAIANGGITVDTTVQLTGTANTFLEVEIFDAAVSKGKAKADEKGIWTLRLTGLQTAEHRFVAKALYGSGTQSPEWAITVTAAATPTITSVKDPKNVEIPHGGLTVETSVTLTGAAAKGLKVEVFDGTVSKGQATANATSGVWTLAVAGLSVAAHSFTAKALYGANPVSAARTLTVTAATAPTITSVKDPKGVEIPNGGTTVETSVTLTGAAAKGLKVEVFDGTVSKGQATANATSGVWMMAISGLSATLHTFTAKGRYGVNPVSEQRKVNVQAVPITWYENFDSRPAQTISSGSSIVFDTMTINFQAGGNPIAITTYAYPVSGMLTGHAIGTNYGFLDETSARQTIMLTPKYACSRVRFAYTYQRHWAQIVFQDTAGELSRRDFPASPSNEHHWVDYSSPAGRKIETILITSNDQSFFDFFQFWS